MCPHSRSRTTGMAYLKFGRIFRVSIQQKAQVLQCRYSSDCSDAMCLSHTTKTPAYLRTIPRKWHILFQLEKDPARQQYTSTLWLDQLEPYHPLSRADDLHAILLGWVFWVFLRSKIIWVFLEGLCPEQQLSPQQLPHFVGPPERDPQCLPPMLHCSTVMLFWKWCAYMSKQDARWIYCTDHTYYIFTCTAVAWYSTYNVWHMSYKYWMQLLCM
jgi:hypothetical protein